MTKKQDLRIQRTRKSLNQALITLMEKKNFQAITIQELADEAMINRVTFYLHYVDKYELLEECVKDNLDEIMLKHLSPVRHIRKGVVYTEAFRPIVMDILKSVENNERFFRVMIQSNCEGLIKDYFIGLVQTKFLPQLGEMFSDIQSNRHVDVTIQLIVSAILGVITWWIVSEERESPEEIAAIVVDVVTKGPAYVLGLKTEK
ncbi:MULTISPECIES: TetR/AcrR family transcriptional regulator [unclassified Oceanobacillus]|uniref:TetR/AcrR family transcriptional regulator n=1 Tax=unclassified Oceanobacillus TaxID=2630292 RepID=UPI0012EBA67A|nr:TetR/AcrR family transcriptional regulator [Oceanobacillus sp. AG]